MVQTTTERQFAVPPFELLFQKTFDVLLVSQDALMNCLLFERSSGPASIWRANAGTKKEELRCADFG